MGLIHSMLPNPPESLSGICLAMGSLALVLEPIPTGGGTGAYAGRQVH